MVEEATIKVQARATGDGMPVVSSSDSTLERKKRGEIGGSLPRIHSGELARRNFSKIAPERQHQQKWKVALSY